ncbi:hypothetical protein FA15DRAFT_218335 [Coprinopsis marcescibilis]|uniref:Uncharacterized protein n=1 Tax=Coprinopsis marcescibilis TaxID=230819 RepID=A0A5C3L3B9_COPMA|nr:hypothetical protein FA15DRAFT_218335 [Coprinopsis marcescibilis]
MAKIKPITRTCEDIQSPQQPSRPDLSTKTIKKPVSAKIEPVTPAITSPSESPNSSPRVKREESLSAGAIAPYSVSFLEHIRSREPTTPVRNSTFKSEDDEDGERAVASESSDSEFEEYGDGLGIRRGRSEHSRRRARNHPEYSSGEEQGQSDGYCSPPERSPSATPSKSPANIDCIRSPSTSGTHSGDDESDWEIHPQRLKERRKRLKRLYERTRWEQEENGEAETTYVCNCELPEVFSDLPSFYRHRLTMQCIILPGFVSGRGGNRPVGNGGGSGRDVEDNGEGCDYEVEQFLYWSILSVVVH